MGYHTVHAILANILLYIVEDLKASRWVMGFVTSIVIAASMKSRQKYGNVNLPKPQ